MSAWASKAAIVQRINATLGGPVIDALAEIVPEVRALPRRSALEVILDDVDLLDRCFQAFRANPDHFRSLLVDRHKMPVDEADAILECGRTLDDIVAMIVRTAAKRHFRRRLDGKSRPLAVRRRKGKGKPDLLTRLVRLFLSAPEPEKKGRTRSELLYDAIKDYLLHDWQVPLVPDYANLPVSTVRRLGLRLLDYRHAGDLQRLRDDPNHAPTPLAKAKPPPASVTGADERPAAAAMAPPPPPPEKVARDERARIEDILTADGKRLKPSAFTIVMLDPKVRESLPNAEQTVRITGIIGSVGGIVARQLVGDLGLRKEQLAVFVMAAHAALGEKAFETAFGLPGRPDYIAKVVERAKAAKIGQDTAYADIAAFVAKVFAGAKQKEKA